MIKVRATGDYSKARRYFDKLLKVVDQSPFDRYGRMGVEALSRGTPQQSGKTASSWEYSITRSKERVTIEWFNTNVNDGVNIAIILQYGHGTGWGKYVQGIDYINPTMAPIFDEISDGCWKEVTGL